MRKLQLFWLKPLLLCAPHHNFWAKLLLRKTMQNLKYQMRKNKKYTLPTRSFIRIAYHKKLQKKTWENDFFLKKKVCYIHSVEEICVLLISHDYIWERLLFAKANTKKRWCKKIYNFFCVTLSSRRECMNANKFSLVFFSVSLSTLLLLSSILLSWIFFFLKKKITSLRALVLCFSRICHRESVQYI